mgnify:FL=1
MALAYMAIRARGRNLIRNEFKKELADKPYLITQLEELESEFDVTTLKGAQFIVELCDIPVVH